MIKEEPKIILSKAENPESALLKGLSKLGGIKSIINEGDKVFITFTLNSIENFPSMINLDVLKRLILECKTAGASKISLGALNRQSVPFKLIIEVMGLENLFRQLGVEIIFLDNSNLYFSKKRNNEELKQKKRKTFSIERIENLNYLIPKEIINSDKFLVLNQVGVHPIFTLNLSILNLLNLTPQSFQGFMRDIKNRKEFRENDEYKGNLIKTIFDIYPFLEPNLIINDFFYVLEAAGPCIYKDSYLRKTNIMVLGDDMLAVDYITMLLLGINPENHELIIEAKKKGIIDHKLIKEILNIENFKSFQINIEELVNQIERIGVSNFFLRKGQICSGCKESIYQLLNLFKSRMIKDLKYMGKTFLVLGDNPPDIEENNKNIILFGDCAIKNTKNHKFRHISKKTKKGVKKLRNKNILELSGCPPSIPECLLKMLDYYKKNNMPMTRLYIEMLKSIDFYKNEKKLRAWRAL